MALNVCRKTHEDLFLGGHPKKRSSWSLWEKIVGKSYTKTFRTSLGKFGEKSFAFQIFACSYTYVCGSMTGSYCSLKVCNITIQHSALACSSRRNDILQVICGILFCYDMLRKALIMWRRRTQRSLQLRAVVRWGRADELDTELHTVHAGTEPDIFVWGATGGVSFAIRGAVNGLCRTFRERPEKFWGGHWGGPGKNLRGQRPPLAPP